VFGHFLQVSDSAHRFQHRRLDGSGPICRRDLRDSPTPRWPNADPDGARLLLRCDTPAFAGRARSPDLPRLGGPYCLRVSRAVAPSAPTSKGPVSPAEGRRHWVDRKGQQTLRKLPAGCLEFNQLEIQRTVKPSPIGAIVLDFLGVQFQTDIDAIRRPGFLSLQGDPRRKVFDRGHTCLVAF